MRKSLSDNATLGSLEDYGSVKDSSIWDLLQRVCAALLDQNILMQPGGNTPIFQ